MRRVTSVAVLAAVLLLSGIRPSLAQEDKGAAAGPQTVRVLVKQYKALSPSDVYRAAIAGTQANVRFRDAFAARTVVPDAVSRVDVGGRTFRAALAFRTEGNLVCLVARSNVEALRTLLGLPGDWPFTDAALNRPIVLNRGQQITTEGTVIGAAVGEKYVLADAVLSDGGSRPAAKRELHLSWGGGGETRVMAQPGVKTFIFASSYKAGETEPLTVTVTAMAPEALLAELARAAALQEGVTGAAKRYGQYTADSVYRQARGQGRGVNVDFTDTIASVRLGALPSALATAPTLRAGQPVELPIGQAFDTAGGITCLVPVTSANLSPQVAGALPGEKVHVRGTVVGPRGAANCVLVDYLGFVGEGEPPEDVWLIAVEHSRAGTMMFWDYGLYTIRNLPSQYVPGRLEVLRLLLGDFRTVRVPRPVAGGQPAAGGQ